MIASLRAGLLLGFGRPGIILGLWLVLVALALPATMLVTDAIESSIGSSRAAESMRSGFDYGWYGEFRDGAGGLAGTFGPTLAGAGAVFSNLEGFATGGWLRRHASVIALGVAFVTAWVFLVGGVLRRYAEPGVRGGAGRFLQDGAALFPRFFRLALLSGGLYLLVYRLHRYLYGRLDDWTADVLAERTVLAYSLAVVALTVCLLSLVHVGFAYAKIATVVENRRSMLFAAVRGFAFVLTHPLQTLGLYAVVGTLTLVLVAIYAGVAPAGGPSTGLGVLAAFLLGQAYLVSRLGLRLSLLGAELTLYRRLTEPAPAPQPAGSSAGVPDPPAEGAVR